jgi:hypothetical protein
VAGLSDSVIRIQPGTYPSFTVAATPPGGLRIVATAPGVFIDTTAAAVTLQSVVPPSFVVLSGMTIGSSQSLNNGISIQGCTGMVDIDECTVTAVNPATGIAVTNSPRVLVHGANVTGGLAVTSNSFAAVTSSTIDDLRVNGNSLVQRCGTTTAQTTVAPGSVLESMPGVMPTIATNEAVSLGTPLEVEFQSSPDVLFAVFLDARLGFFSMPGTVFELPALLEFVAPILLLFNVTAANGLSATSPLLPNDPLFLGLPLFLQGVEFRANSLRFTNLGTLTVVP